MRKLQVIKSADIEKFEEQVNEFVSTHKIINITYAIRQGYADVHMHVISAFVAFIEYEETDGTEPEGKKIKELEEENTELKKVKERKSRNLKKKKKKIKELEADKR